MLTITNLSARVANKLVLNDFSLTIKNGEIHVLMGPNGVGKSSLAMTLLGENQYVVASGIVDLDGQNLLKMSVDERARKGLFVAFQNPISVPGVSVFAFLRAINKSVEYKNLSEFRKYLEELAVRVGLPSTIIARHLNDGFSGGEKKRLELMQLLLLKPKVAILDEIDSGLDENGRQMLGHLINKMKGEGTSFIIITHYEKMLDLIKLDKVWEMRNGQIQIRL